VCASGLGLMVSWFGKSIKVVENYDGNSGMVWEEFGYGKAEMLGDEEDTLRWWWYNLL